MLIEWLKDRKEKRTYLKERKNLQKNKGSELIIGRPDGLDRCSLTVSSKDTEQLKELQKKLEQREIETVLLENFQSGYSDYKLNLTPKETPKISFEENIIRLLKTLERVFRYGQPIKDIDFFTEDEKKLLKKWY